MRLDAYLVQSGRFESRARAQGAVKAGLVRVDGAVVTKPAAELREGAEIIVDGDIHNFVSRGGLKLDAALRTFQVDAAGKICLDLGASTGGFTDVLLRAGAAKVYAVDVGTGQLHDSIAQDIRVINLEKTHAKDLSRARIPDEIDVLVCDVSFIGLRKALPPAMALCAPRADLVALIKPQFELGPEKIGKGGLVSATEAEVAAMVESIRDWFEREGWVVRGVIDSPITGGDGNKECLIGAVRKI